MTNLFLLEDDGQIWLPVQSGSMAPRFLIGDEILVSKKSQSWLRSNLHCGSVAVFYFNGKFLFHRILVSLSSRGWYYQVGDAELYGGWIRCERFVGVVVAHRRMTGSDFTTCELDFRPRRNAMIRLLWLVLYRRPKNEVTRIARRCINIILKLVRS